MVSIIANFDVCYLNLELYISGEHYFAGSAQYSRKIESIQCILCS